MNTNITIAQFELQTISFLNQLSNITDEESNKQAANNINPIKWVAGHIVNTRMSLLRILAGVEQDTKFNRSFGKGSSNKIYAETPDIEEIKVKWNTVSETLIFTLKNLSNEKLNSAPPFQTSIPDKTILGLTAYMAIHEAHHLGQLSVLQKLI